MNKKKILGVSLLVVLIAVLAIVSYVFTNKPEEQKKNESTNTKTEETSDDVTMDLKEVIIEVVDSKGESKKYQLDTDAETLREAMDEAEGLEYSGTEGQYGIMVDTVNGETADFTKDGAYWSFYVNGEYCMSGIDTQPVNDGDKFQIKYEK